MLNYVTSVTVLDWQTTPRQSRDGGAEKLAIQTTERRVVAIAAHEANGAASEAKLRLVRMPNGILAGKDFGRCLAS